MAHTSEEKYLKPDDVAIIVRRFSNDETAKVIDHVVEDYSADKLGLLGGQKRLDITFQVRKYIVFKRAMSKCLVLHVCMNLITMRFGIFEIYKILYCCYEQIRCSNILRKLINV